MSFSYTSRDASGREKKDSKLERWFEAQPKWIQVLIPVSALLCFIFLLALVMGFLLPVNPDKRKDEPPRPVCTDEFLMSPSSFLWTLALLVLANAAQPRGYRASQWWPRRILSLTPVPMLYDLLLSVAILITLMVKGTSWKDSCYVVMSLRAEALEAGDLLFREPSFSKRKATDAALDGSNFQDPSDDAAPDYAKIVDSDLEDGLVTTRASHDEEEEADFVADAVNVTPFAIQPPRQRLVQFVSIAIVLLQIAKLRSVSGALGPKVLAYICIFSFILVEICQLSLPDRQLDRKSSKKIQSAAASTGSIKSPVILGYRGFWFLSVWMEYTQVAVLYLITQEINISRLMTSPEHQFSFKESARSALEFTVFFPLSQMTFFTLLFLPFPSVAIRNSLIYPMLARAGVARFQGFKPKEGDEFWTECWNQGCRAMWYFAAIVIPLIIMLDIVPVGGTTETFDNGVPPFAQMVPLQYNCTTAVYTRKVWWIM